MAIPSSGEIKISEIATEFGDTAPNQMSEYYRGGGLVPNTPANAAVPTSGQIAVADFYGAQNRASVPLTISANTQNYNVYTQASASPLYVAGSTDITLTIQPGVLVGSSSTGSYALSVPNSFNPADTVTIVNNGVVIGRGGNGGSGGSASPFPFGVAGGGAVGGYAVYVNFPTTITNNGTLAGGGGGGGGGRAGQVVSPPTNPKQPSGPVTNYGGGGGGGGAGYPGGSGGGGGSPGGGSGSSGSSTAGGGGGAGPGPAGSGGAGGGRGANGSAGQPSPNGAGASGGTRGYYLVGNPFVTFPATGTRQGLVS